jgi:UDP-N-acetylglucosamine--N-acetylmuramyl-(pentapeptide) pyrophosphoryl-undecaprenol N-acetylglucosamine transferase
MTENSEKSPPNILVAASGSGGHLLPAVAIAKAIQAKLPNANIVFVGAGRSLEKELIETNGYQLEVLPLKPLRRMGLKGLAVFLASLPLSIWKAFRLINRIKPQLAVGVGGYASVLPVLIAQLCGAKVMVHEAERTPGWANKLLGMFANRITTAHKETNFPPRAPTVWTGHPLRQALLAASFNKSVPEKPEKVLIVGGSQGARALDFLGKELAPFFAAHQLSIIHQCRAENQKMLEEAYEGAGLEAKVVPFIHAMEEVYQWSDFVIARAGAGLIRELELIGRPALLVPLPGAEEQHANARDLEASNQGKIVGEGPEFSARVQETLATMLEPSTYKEMAHFSASPRQHQDPTQKIAEIAILLLSQHNGA